VIKPVPKYYLILLSLLALTCTGGRYDIEATQSKSAHAIQKEEAEKRGLEGMSGRSHVETGLDVLIDSDFNLLRGKRVGVITNHTGLSKDGRHIVDIITRFERAELRAVFGPEHGVRGVEPDGKSLKSEVDEGSGVPIYSLYGKSKRPTEEMIEKLDVLIFDIQDVGARFYTYIYTMALAMEAAALNGKRFIVLDRPNPITGSKVEGPMLHSGYESFVGMFPLPVRHGMTVGELALLFKGEGWIDGADSLDLKIIKMKGWSRNLWFDQTDIKWNSPSPSMRTLNTATVYPGSCFIEGTNLSEGRGTEIPFEIIGAPWVDSKKLAREMNGLGLEGVSFEAVEFTPIAMLPSVPNPKYKDKVCGGVKIRVSSRELFEPVKTGVSLIWTLKKLYPAEFKWSRTIDRLYGSDVLKVGVNEGKPLDEILSGYEHGMDEFLEIRSNYLLYE